MKWNCLIVDDEAIARKLLVEYIAKIPELELCGTCNTALEAMQYLRNHQVDILLLDIQMPDITGLDFIDTLDKRPFTILTTAYSEYAVKSYELGVEDYLLKPIEFDRFYKAIGRFTRKQGPHISITENTSPSKPDKLFVKSDNKIIKINFQDILVIHGKGAYVQIILTNNRKIITLQSMSKLEEVLPKHFFRTHRSHIVNINHIDSIEGNTIYLGDQIVVLSKNKRDEFFDKINGSNLLN